MLNDAMNLQSKTRLIVASNKLTAIVAVPGSSICASVNTTVPDNWGVRACAAVEQRVPHMIGVYG